MLALMTSMILKKVMRTIARKSNQMHKKPKQRSRI